MRLDAIEKKARLALFLFVITLVLTIAVTLALYAKDRREMTEQSLRRLGLEALTIASTLSSQHSPITDSSLRAILDQRGFPGSAAAFESNGQVIARASAGSRAPEDRLMAPRQRYSSRLDSDARHAQGLSETSTRRDGGFDFSEAPLSGGRLVVIARPSELAPAPVVFYVFSSQIVSIVAGLAFILLLMRWMFRPYRRMVEAARGSPVKASSYKSESEFVVETFQALVEKLQSKEKELAGLHALERIRAERSERFSERLIVNIPSGLVTIDADGIVTSANTQALDVFTFREAAPNEETGIRRESGMHPISACYRTFFETAPRLMELVADCIKNGTTSRREEVDVFQPHGRMRHLGLSLSPMFDDAHNIEGALCLMTDITEVIELRERMKLQENLANLGEMAAGLAHEFKNSLATIHGYAQLLEAQMAAASGQDGHHQTVEGMLNEVRLLARLVTDFLNFARPQQLSLAPVDLESLMRESADEVNALIEQSGIELRISGRYTTVLGDESLLRRVFVNLLRNAAEAIDPNAARKLIEVSAAVDSEENGRYAHIRVRDTGGGISESDLNKVFIPFFTTKARGYGIGLAIVQKILVAHGGDVSVESSDATGTQFHCRLPLRLAATMK